MIIQTKQIMTDHFMKYIYISQSIIFTKSSHPSLKTILFFCITKSRLKYYKKYPWILIWPTLSKPSNEVYFLRSGCTIQFFAMALGFGKDFFHYMVITCVKMSIWWGELLNVLKRIIYTLVRVPLITVFNWLGLLTRNKLARDKLKLYRVFAVKNIIPTKTPKSFWNIQKNVNKLY